MVDFIDGDLDTVDLLIYGTDTHLNEDVVKHQMSDFMENLLPSSVLFFTSVLNLQKQMAKNRAIQRAKGAFRKVKSLWQDEYIHEMKTIGDFQHAPDRMRRFIMAEPTIRALWQNQLCDGYNDLCENERHLSGDQVSEYRQVMDGVMEMQPEESEYDYVITQYDNFEDNVDRITVEEQFDIFRSWERLNVLIATGEEDPTSETNGWLSV